MKSAGGTSVSPRRLLSPRDKDKGWTRYWCLLSHDDRKDEIHYFSDMKVIIHNSPQKKKKNQLNSWLISAEPIGGNHINDVLQTLGAIKARHRQTHRGELQRQTQEDSCHPRVLPTEGERWHTFLFLGYCNGGRERRMDPPTLSLQQIEEDAFLCFAHQREPPDCMIVDRGDLKKNK